MYTCAQCARSYKRPEHLQRHLGTHSSERPYVCQLCQATFQRSDVLRRHSKTCSSHRPKDAGLSAYNAPPNGGGNAARTVLDDETGAFDDLSDYLDWLPDINEYADLVVPDLLPTEALVDGGQPSSLLALPRHAAPLRFLEGFTRHSGLVPSFDCGTEHERFAVLAYLREKETSEDKSQSGVKSLTAKCGEIVALVKEVATVKPRNSPVDLTWSSAVEGACISFFDPRSVERYLGLFWAIWHPNVNFMHRATFEPQTAKAILVATMAVIGATVSPDPQDNIGARTWFNAVEEMVFIDEDFCADSPDRRVFASLSKVQSLQAAYIVCLYQNWEGTDSSKARIRRFRYSTVVAMARDLGISKARRVRDDRERPISGAWTDIAVQEQLIRTLLWVFLLDTAFVIFHNFPPRMAIREMKMHFACNEAAFQATTFEEYNILSASDTASAKVTLTGLVELMCRPTLDLDTQAEIAGLGPLNLFVLTSAFHVMLFQAQQNFNVQASLQPLSNALDNWVSIWQVYVGVLGHLPVHNPLAGATITPESMWRRIGFSRFADEYWLLTRLICDRMKAAAERQDYMNADTSHVAADDSTASATGQTKESILTEYDETSMQQVNELITDFQRFLI